MSLTALRAEIAHEIAKRVRRLSPEASFDDAHPHRLKDARDNLAPGVSYEVIRSDLLDSEERGVAHGRTRLEELSSVDSSTALAVNTFGPFRILPELFRLPGLAGFHVLRLGKKLRTGPGGGAPARLDLLAVGEQVILGVNCVLTEPLSPKTVSLAESCSRSVADVASPEWSDLYDSLCAHPTRFRFLDAPTLIRQYLGLRCALADEPQPKVLLYVFWEPEEWAEVPAFTAHRREVLEFSLAVSGSDVAFVSMSCAELWDAMEEGPAWGGRSVWLDYLRDRYIF